MFNVIKVYSILPTVAVDQLFFTAGRYFLSKEGLWKVSQRGKMWFLDRKALGNKRSGIVIIDCAFLYTEHSERERERALVLKSLWRGK